MAYNPKPILVGSDKQFQHGSHQLNFGVRGNAADGDVTFVIGKVINNLDFDMQIQWHEGHDGFGTGSNADVRAKVISVLPSLNAKIVEIYGPLSGGTTNPPANLFEVVLAAATAFCKNSVVYDPAIGLKAI